MTVKNFTLIVLVLMLGLTASAKKKQPNLIIIHTDEHSFRTLSCYQNIMTEEQAFVWGKGNNIKTPNIDRIANEGVLCSKYYASSPVCTPSRASLITGLHPQATGAPKNGDHIRKDVNTFAKVLIENGYATSYVGKWHLDGHDKYTFGIEYKAGFNDNTYMMRGGHAPYFKLNTDGKVDHALNQRAGEKLYNEGDKSVVYVTDFFTDKALEILERDKDKPFCLMLSIPDPHTPDAAREPYKKMYADMDVQAPITMSAEYIANKPLWATNETGKKNEADGFNAKALRNYFGMVKCIDDNVGRILKFLADNELEDNTIIVFTADHGDMFFEHNRKNKGVPYEASAKIPFVLRYPDKVPAGKIINKAYSNVDFSPTILSLMGVTDNYECQGTNTAADFISKEKVVNGNRIVYFAKNGGWWVCAADSRYKLVLDKKEKPWLFDLEKDPYETVNYYLDPAYAEIAKRLQDELFVQMKKYKEPGLKPKSPYILD